MTRSIKTTILGGGGRKTTLAIPEGAIPIEHHTGFSPFGRVG